VVAASVPWTRQVLRDGEDAGRRVELWLRECIHRTAGFADVHATAEKVAEVLEISAADVGVCQTGVIGVLAAMPLLLCRIDVVAGSCPLRVATALPGRS